MVAVIDVCEARGNRILPFPAVVRGADQAVTVIEYAAPDRRDQRGSGPSRPHPLGSQAEDPTRRGWA